MMNDYFENKKLLVGEIGVRDMTSGVSQGSFLGSILGTVFYDSVLHTKLPLWLPE